MTKIVQANGKNKKNNQPLSCHGKDFVTAIKHTTVRATINIDNQGQINFRSIWRINRRYHFLPRQFNKALVTHAEFTSPPTKNCL